ncbi:MAG: hypothetical protein QHH00_06150 [Methanomassiliicoccales archaeon]|jgi:hypothetical protein|nr:hypothetical protein [Methanomassiliicoccales archaeon]MDH7508965.1 hypothetical protein [Methanomassiliicoccales archaeon]
MMQVKGFEANGIEAKRFSKVGERFVNIRIDQNSSVTRISKASDDDTASVEFRFTTNYAGIGYIRIEGQVFLSGDAGNLVDEWTRTGSMPDEIANIVHNVIVSNCIPIALLVARDVRLPPPIPLPKINIQRKGSRGPGESVEVA